MMVINEGEKLHISYRAFFENSTRRHFLGEVIALNGTVCRVRGYAFVYDADSASFMRKPELRTTIANLGDSGYIAYIIPPHVELNKVYYTYLREVGLIATDSAGFTLNINEFNLEV